MEIDLNMNDSSADFTHVSNLSFLTESTDVRQTFKWTNAQIARVIQILFRPILIIIGTTGNSLSFYIMRKTSLKDVSSCFYMAILALADTSKYISILFLGRREVVHFIYQEDL